jgi:4-alpha-glucanotransferase
VKKKTPTTNPWGIDLNYEDAFGEWHDTPGETVKAILQAMGADPDAEGPARSDKVLVVKQSEARNLGKSGTIRLETGKTLSFSKQLPPDLPLGYHDLHLKGNAEVTRLIVSPAKCWLPQELRTWGWAVQLYSARSRESWGIGDFRDLDRLASWSSSELGAGMMLINPLSAPAPITHQQASPYYPSSRRFLNPLWIHIPWVPGASSESVPGLERIARAAQELNQKRQIDRDRVFDEKMKALCALWSFFPGDARFDSFSADCGIDLHRFATFCALAQTYNSGWHCWPEQFRDPKSPAVERFARDNVRNVQFHKWLQWLIDVQLEKSSRHLALMQDLPIGVDPDGADAWAWQDVLANGVAVGAPPDEFNTQGQNWGLPPFIPEKLRQACYEPFIQTIRAGFRHGGGLRIDHVMGLFRLFWVPSGMQASQGAYVRYDPDDMLSIVALESVRAKAYVVGEDLGTVEEAAREKLSQYGVMSYRLLWFEKDDPRTYPREALAAVTTPDRPTVAGLWTGTDLDRQHHLGLKPNEESTAEICERLRTSANLSADSKLDEVVEGAYKLLGNAPSRIVTAALDDAALALDRPNFPATTCDQNPNWSIALPAPIEDLMKNALPRRIARALSRTGGTPPPSTD